MKPSKGYLMIARAKIILFACNVAIAYTTVAPLAAQTSSARTEQSAAELEDVCPDGWLRYRCSGVRLCVARGVDIGEDLLARCSEDHFIVPEPWSHASPEQAGWNDIYSGSCSLLVYKVVRLDSSTYDRYYKNSYNRAASMYQHESNRQNFAKVDVFDNLIHDASSEDYIRGENEYQPYLPLEHMSLEQNGLPPPDPKPSVKEVCPAGWQRYSCKFSRLCVSSDVAAKYDLKNARAFRCAACSSDENVVSDEDTHATPEDVGYAAGAMIGGNSYVNVVKLNLWDIRDGKLDEAIEQLLLIPPGMNANREWFHGFLRGRAKYEEILAKFRAKKEAGSSRSSQKPK